VQRLLWSESAAALRYAAPPSGVDGGAPGYDVVLESKAYDITDASSSTRPRIRKCLKCCEIAPLTLERYAREGWLLEAATRERQGRSSRGREAWEKMVRAAAGLDGFEAWGAIVDCTLAASVLFVQIDDCATMLYQQSHHRFWPLHVNNGLTSP
jgi:hypothetical protein